MQTSVTENDLDLSELDALLNEANSQAANIEAQIGALENENAVLLKKISTASIEDAATYRRAVQREQDTDRPSERRTRGVEEETVRLCPSKVGCRRRQQRGDG